MLDGWVRTNFSPDARKPTSYYLVQTQCTPNYITHFSVWRAILQYLTRNIKELYFHFLGKSVILIMYSVFDDYVSYENYVYNILKQNSSLNRYCQKSYSLLHNLRFDD